MSRMASDLQAVGAVPLAEMREELRHCAKGLPLRGKDGTLKAFAMVDADDFEAFSRYRWYLRPNGYVARQVQVGRKKQQTLLLHRAVMGLGVGDPGKVDHRHHNLLDNRRSQLRVCTHAQNCQNRSGANKGSSSQYRGVSFRKDKTARPWQAYGAVDGHITHLGFFSSEEAAGEAAAAWRRQHLPYSTT